MPTSGSGEFSVCRGRAATPGPCAAVCRASVRGWLVPTVSRAVNFPDPKDPAVLVLRGRGVGEA